MATPEAVLADDLVERDPWYSRAWLLIKKQPLGAVGAAIVIAMIIMAVFADVIAPYDPESNDYEAMEQSPNAAHWLGTDQFGRDILSRIIYGSRTALVVGFTAAIIGSFAGLLIGVASAYFGGIFDLIVQRVMDVIMAFPLIILALAIVSILGGGLQNVLIAIIIPFVPQCARVVRSSALAIREIPYVDAARAMGFGSGRIILKHMIPNVMAPFLIMMTSFMGQAILTEATLSFLGMGVQEPTPAWGLMLFGAEEFFESAPWMIWFPGLAIALAVFAFNMFGDAVRDVLDPRLRTE